MVNLSSAERMVWIFFTSIQVLIIARVILSWLPFRREDNDIVEFIYSFTEPILRPLRLVLPLGGMGGLDLSPIIALIIINLLQELVLNLI